MTNEYDLKGLFPGIMLTIATGCLAFFLAGMHKAMDPLVVGIVLGMFVRGLVGTKDLFKKGLAIVPKLFIPFGIIVYGVNLQFHKLNVIPFVAWMQIGIGVILIFMLGVYLTRKMCLSYGSSLLICVGTAICGASAIALATPVLESDPEDTGIALLTITFWGITGLFLFPIIESLIVMSPENYAFFCATTLHQTGLVKIASSQYSPECQKIAMIIKMGRTCMIIPILIGISYFKKAMENSKIESRVSDIFTTVPWFVWGFVFVGALFSFSAGLHPYVSKIKPIATILWTMAMTSLGLSIQFREILPKLGRPVIFGLIIWAVLLGNFFIGYFGMGY